MSTPHLLSLLLLLSLANRVRSLALQAGDGTSFWVDSFSNLTYEGDAFIPSDSSFVRLIGTDGKGNPHPRSAGRLLHTAPLHLWEPGRQASFETTIRFRVSTVPGYLPADGLTFFIVPANSTLPTGGWGGNLGIFNAVAAGAKIYAVEFDIYVNPEFDPAFPHIGIDINSRASANVTRFEGAVGQAVTARISYDAPTRRTEVVATYGSQTATVSYVYDLKTLLPQQVQVGISGSVGPTQAVLFDVTSWYFTSTLVRDPDAIDVM